MKHQIIGHSAIFTCHACQAQNEQRTIEWPPLIFACGNEDCNAIYRFLEENQDGTVKMKLISKSYGRDF